VTAYHGEIASVARCQRLIREFIADAAGRYSEDEVKDWLKLSRPA
jgi:hypothetical protein